MSDNRERRDDDVAKDAQARLDQLRGEAGGALSGREILKRLGLDPEQGDDGAPPLDWRPTPMNILLQLLAIGAFLLAMGFMLSMFFGGFWSIINHLGGV